VKACLVATGSDDCLEKKQARLEALHHRAVVSVEQRHQHKVGARRRRVGAHAPVDDGVLGAELVDEGGKLEWCRLVSCTIQLGDAVVLLHLGVRVGGARHAMDDAKTDLYFVYCT
jgi:hypothetical protein